MKALQILSVCLFLTLSAFAQSKSGLLEFKARIGFDDEAIWTTKFLDNDSKLMLISEKNIQVWDIANAKLLKSFPHEIVNPDKLYGAGLSYSPDGRKLIVLDMYGWRLKKEDKKVVASAYDLQTGKKIAVLERPAFAVRHAFWSENGETVVTFSGLLNQHKETEISFWNGADLAHRNSIIVNGYTWHYLTRDGAKLFVGNGGQNKILGLSAGADDGDVIRVYDAKSGKVVKEFTAGGRRFEVDNGETYVSFDERFLVTSTDKNALVWEVAGSGSEPKYEIAPRNQKKRVWVGGFSKDGKYLRIRQGSDREFYETETGKLIADVPQTVQWETQDEKLLVTPDKKYAVRQSCGKANIVDLNSNRELYQFKFDCDGYYEPFSGLDSDDSPDYYKSDAVLALDSSGELLLEFRDSVVNVRRTKTGEILQTISKKDAEGVGRWRHVSKQIGDYFVIEGNWKNSLLIWKVNAN